MRGVWKYFHQFAFLFQDVYGMNLNISPKAPSIERQMIIIVRNGTLPRSCKILLTKECSSSLRNDPTGILCTKLPRAVQHSYHSFRWTEQNIVHYHSIRYNLFILSNVFEIYLTSSMMFLQFKNNFVVEYNFLNKQYKKWMNEGALRFPIQQQGNKCSNE